MMIVTLAPRPGIKPCYSTLLIFNQMECTILRSTTVEPRFYNIILVNFDLNKEI